MLLTFTPAMVDDHDGYDIAWDMDESDNPAIPYHNER